MAHQTEIVVNGQTVEVTEFDHTAQEIDDMCDGLEAALPGNGGLPIAQGGTGATTPQAALNALGAGVRPSELDNAIFVGGGSQQGGGQLPINQRGQTSYSNPEYTCCIDRWKLTTPQSSIEIVEDGIILRCGITTGSPTVCFMQTLLHALNDDDFTLSAIVTEKVGDWSMACNSLYDSDAQITTNGITTKTILKENAIHPNKDFYFFKTSTGANDYIKIQAAKIERGKNQTLGYQDEDGDLHILPQSESDYATQLIKCLLYYWDSDSPGYGGCSGIAINPTTLMCNVQFPIPMRTIPSVMLYGNGEVNKVRSTGDGTLISIPSSGSYARNKSGIAFIYCPGSSIFTTSMGYDFRIVANAEL